MKSRGFKSVWRMCLMAAVCVCFLTAFSQNVFAMKSVSVEKEITITGIDGKQYRPQDFQEEFVVLIFGRTMCLHCAGMVDRAEELLKCGAPIRIVLMIIEIEDGEAKPEELRGYAQAHPDVLVAYNEQENANMMFDLLSKVGLIGNGSIDLPATFIMDKSRTVVRASTYASEDDAWNDFGRTVETIASVPHHYKVTEKEQTCDKPGLRSKVCQNCGETSEEILPALGHQPGPEATCTQAQSCTRCGEILQPALGHQPGPKATCTQAQSCTRCGEILQPALEHQPGPKATCTQAQSCTRCGEILQPAFGHDWSQWSTVEQATVFAPAKQERICRREGCDARDRQSVGDVLPAFLKLSKSAVSLRVNESYVYKLEGMQKGDSLSSVTPYASGIVKVSDVKKSGSFSLKGLKAGKVELEVELESGESDIVTVTVENEKTTAAGKSKKTIKTTAIKKVPKKIVLKKGKSKTLKPVLVPAKSKQKITFKSSNKKVAKVSKKGKITAKKKGTAIITVTSGSKKVKCKVIVK